MAVQRWVDTAATVGGDGQSQAHTDDASGHRAHKSLFDWEANSGGSATENYIVDCAGSASDTTVVTIDFTVNITTGSITINGDRAAPDNDGFYTGDKVTSTAHYRLVPASGSCLLFSEVNITIDGIQIEAAGGSFLSAIDITNVLGAFTIRKCRLRAASATHYGIGSGASVGFNTSLRTIENNLIVGFNVNSILINVSSFFSRNFLIQENTLYGDGASTGITLTLGAGTTETFVVKANAVANHGTGNCFTGTAADTYSQNATDSAEGTSGEVDLLGGGATLADAWTNHGTGQTNQFTVKNSSSKLYNIVNPTLVTKDITDFTRDGTNHDIGAFELQGAASSAIKTVNGLAKASIKTINGLAIASVKTRNGLA